MRQQVSSLSVFWKLQKSASSDRGIAFEHWNLRFGNVSQKAKRRAKKAYKYGFQNVSPSLLSNTKPKEEKEKTKHIFVAATICSDRPILMGVSFRCSFWLIKLCLCCCRFSSFSCFLLWLFWLLLLLFWSSFLVCRGVSVLFTIVFLINTGREKSFWQLFSDYRYRFLIFRN